MRAFTLIETVVYLALLSFLLAAAIAVLGSVSAAADEERTDANTEAEGAFILGKIEWTLLHTYHLTSPRSATSTRLSVTLDDSGDPVVIQIRDGTIQMGEKGQVPVPLNSANAIATNLSFTPILDGRGAPAGMDASFMLDGTLFETHTYFMP